MGFIYKITNQVNGKVYVGKTEDTVEKRWKKHQIDYKRERCKDRPLYRAMLKYGVDCFSIDEVEQTDQAEEREIYWIDYYKSYSKGYNATKGGDGRRYLDEDKILELHLEGKSLLEIAETVNCAFASAKKVVVQAGFIPNDHKMRITTNKFILNKTTGIIYSSQRDAARSLNSTLVGSKLASLANKISLCCRGVRRSVLGQVFEYYVPL
jgi:hypothetical protein